MVARRQQLILLLRALGRLLTTQGPVLGNGVLRVWGNSAHSPLTLLASHSFYFFPVDCRKQISVVWRPLPSPQPCGAFMCVVGTGEVKEGGS